MMSSSSRLRTHHASQSVLTLRHARRDGTVIQRSPQISGFAQIWILTSPLGLSKQVSGAAMLEVSCRPRGADETLIKPTSVPSRLAAPAKAIGDTPRGRFWTTKENSWSQTLLTRSLYLARSFALVHREPPARQGFLDAFSRQPRTVHQYPRGFFVETQTSVHRPQ